MKSLTVLIAVVQFVILYLFPAVFCNVARSNNTVMMVLRVYIPDGIKQAALSCKHPPEMNRYKAKIVLFNDNRK